MTPSEAREILTHVQYKDWEFFVDDDEFYLQVRWIGDDAVTGEFGLLTGRKWRLSEHMVKNEVVQTALKAVLTAEEHEARERFTYKGVSIFGPHHDVDALIGVVREVRA